MRNARKRPPILVACGRLDITTRSACIIAGEVPFGNLALRGDVTLFDAGESIHDHAAVDPRVATNPGILFDYGVAGHYCVILENG